jgi:hypothetical protein
MTAIGPVTCHFLFPRPCLVLIESEHKEAPRLFHVFDNVIIQVPSDNILRTHPYLEQGRGVIR